MAENPIQELMDTAMSNIKAMVDVNTIVGDAVTAPDGTIIIPVSTVSFGFGAGGSEFAAKGQKMQTIGSDKTLFGGGCGGGAKVTPIAFLTVGGGRVRILPVSQNSSPVDKIIDLVPDMVDKVNGVIAGTIEKIADKKEKKAQEKAERAERKNTETHTMVDVVAP